MAFVKLPGRVVEINPVVKINDVVSKQDIVIETEEEKNGKIYSEILQVSFSGKRLELMQGLNVGDERTFLCDVRGKVKLPTEKNGTKRYYTQLSVFKIEDFK